MVTYGYISERDMSIRMLKCIVISESLTFLARKEKEEKKSYEGEKIQSFSELQTGDYVVHENHGLGIYRGIEK